MNVDILNTLVMLLLAVLGMGYVTLVQRRSAKEVLRALSAERNVEKSQENDLNWYAEPKREQKVSVVSPRDVAKNRKVSWIQISLALAMPMASFLSGHATPSGLIAFFLGGVSLGYLAKQIRARAKEVQYSRSIDFFLPIVMERISMAAQSGLDIISGIKTVIAIDCNDQQKDSSRKAQRDNNPVVDLLGAVIDRTEAGLGFAQSLREVAKKTESTGLKHAFIHLALAHQEGGELAAPLRELSDATQLYYQETIEEEIARLPVKATMPLLLTFAGLIICFITSPMIQILQMTTKAMPGH